MDAQRFDNLAKSLAGRLSRRGALRRAGAAAAAGVLAPLGLRASPAAAQGTGEPVYTVIRRYSVDDPSAVRAALEQGYVADACKAQGFVAYFTVEDEDGDFATVAVFRSQQDFANFAGAEANWIAQNLDDLLPAPDIAVSGPSYIHAGSREAFRGTCPGEPAAPTAAPDQPTAVPAPTGAPTAAPAPTAVPAGPTPTAVPACTGQGCVCVTGTQAPCDQGLVCCPTTDLMGGPGVCQTEAACYPNSCTEDGDSCPTACAANSSCPLCCNLYCNGNDVCDSPPACSSQGCECDFHDPNSCDAGLLCTAVQGGFQCLPQNCTGEGCSCMGGVAGNCDPGLVCCLNEAPVIGGVGGCVPEAQCGGGAPCTGANCQCDFNDPNSCDQGLVCCAVQSGFICVDASQCGPTSCTGQGCDCIGGAQGACDDGLICCVQGDPGAPGTCQTMAACPGSLCTGEGCDCAMDNPSCQDGLICCGPGATGTCQTQDNCTG